MPIYEYECTKCGERFEQYRSLAAGDAEIECPKCGQEHPRRVLSLFSASCSSTGCAPSAHT